jgi:hypothetical protein
LLRHRLRSAVVPATLHAAQAEDALSDDDEEGAVPSSSDHGRDTAHPAGGAAKPRKFAHITGGGVRSSGGAFLGTPPVSLGDAVGSLFAVSAFPSQYAAAATGGGAASGAATTARRSGGAGGSGGVSGGVSASAPSTARPSTAPAAGVAARITAALGAPATILGAWAPQPGIHSDDTMSASPAVAESLSQDAAWEERARQLVPARDRHRF